jgi:tetratricopeptide (TPR) repeat protein
VLVAASQLAVERKDFDAAIRMLDKIAVDSPTYTRAQIIKAEILLTHNRDKEGFTQCYQQLVEKEDSAQNHALLGDAYLRILNPEAAVDSLEAAYRLDPSNGRLRTRIGRALVATHEYHRAVDFYEGAIREVTKGAPASSKGQGKSELTSAVARTKTSEAVFLSHDLAKLYLKLGRAESSARILQRVLHDSHRDATDMRQDVATLLLLVQVQTEGVKDRREVVDTLLKAKGVQRDLLSALRSDVTMSSSQEAIEGERLALSSICEQVCILYYLYVDSLMSLAGLHFCVGFDFVTPSLQSF